MSGVLLNTEEMRHYGIKKDQVLSRREGLVNSEPRLFVVLCSVNDAEKLLDNHSNIVMASFGEYTNRGGKQGMLKAPKGVLLGPVGGFYRAKEE